jgi:hypothetical protein
VQNAHSLTGRWQPPFLPPDLRISKLLNCHPAQSWRAWRYCTAGDEGVVGVTARLATVDDEPLARVLSAQYRGLMCVVTVADMPCRDRMAKMLAQHKFPMPDMLALTQSIPYR